MILRFQTNVLTIVSDFLDKSSELELSSIKGKSREGEVKRRDTGNGKA